MGATSAKPIQLDGQVVSYKTNPESNIDKIILSRGNQKFEIHFPPHLAKHILEIAKVNAWVHIETSQRDRGYELVSISSQNGKNIFDTKEISPPKPNPGKEITITGSISKLIRDQNGEIKGFVVGKKTVLLKPEESRTLAPLLMKAHQVEVTALERDTKDGTINTLQFPPVVMTEIKIDSIIYKIH